MLVTALTPAAADLDARAQAETLRRMCVVSTKYMAAAAVPLSVFTLAAAGPLLRAWLGDQPGLDTAAGVLRLLALGYLANLLAGPAMSVALGMGRADLAMRAGLVSAAANILLTVLLVYPWGVYGVAAATSLGMLISTAWFARVMAREFGLDPRGVARETLLWPAVASLPGLVVCTALARAFANETGQAAQLGVIVCGGLCFALTYAVVLRFSPFLNAFDRSFLGETLGLARVPGLRALLGGARHA
jgi:O-antigen/teichoic acid export membrane protein